jgi:hypothetical protein
MGSADMIPRLALEDEKGDENRDAVGMKTDKTVVR